MPMRSNPCVREPRDRAPRVEHRLPAHLQGPRDVRADDVVGALQFRRHPSIVIRQAQAKRGHAVHREQPAQADVAAGVGVPLRQHEHGRAASASSATERSAGSRPCCSRRAASRRRDGNVSMRSPSAPGALKSVVVGRLRREETRRYRPSRGRPSARGPVPAASPGGRPFGGNPVETPFERPDDAVLRHGGELPLPRMEEGLKHSALHAILSGRCSPLTLESGVKRATRVGGRVLDC